jgi:hypothetical protein
VTSKQVKSDDLDPDHLTSLVLKSPAVKESTPLLIHLRSFMTLCFFNTQTQHIAGWASPKLAAVQPKAMPLL